MNRLLFACLFACASAAVAAPAPAQVPEVRTIDSHLTYVRLARLPADLPASSAAAERGTVILDLRGTPGDAAGAKALGAWIQAHAKPAAPVFILVDATTAGPLMDLLQDLSDTNLPIVSFGPAALGDAVDVPVDITEAQDQAAFGALEKGASIETLTSPRINKPRQDEAELDRDLRDGIRPDYSDDSDSQDLNAPEPKPPLVDLVLARAIQLDHALLALGRLPSRRH